MNISSENWTHTRYKNNSLMAFISIGGDEAGNISYFNVLLDEAHTEHFQEEFSDLELACKAINAKYSGLWEYEDQVKPKAEGGCATCVAH